MFLDVVNNHLRIEFESKNVSRILLSKNHNLDVKSLTSNKIFNVKSILRENKMDNETLLNGLLSTDFYARINKKDRMVKVVSNFNNLVDHLFWTIIETESVQLIYDRKPKLYRKWFSTLKIISIWDKHIVKKLARDKTWRLLSVLTLF